jgi:hypothetical protein
MLVVIAILMIWTSQCAGGAFVRFHPDCYMSLSSSSLLLERSSFHRLNKNTRGVQKIVHGLLPQMTILWNATTGSRVHQRLLFVAMNEVAVQSARCFCP